MYFAQTNSNLNPLSAKYIMDIDDIITNHADQYPFIFGHSNQLDNLMGYWVFVQTYKYNAFYGQLAIGSKGNLAIRFYNQTSWTDWVFP